MIDTIQVPSELADNVEKELYSLRVNWQYYDKTTPFYEDLASEEERRLIDKFSTMYGPVNDTQRFTHTVYFNRHRKEPFFVIRNDPRSDYRKNFKFLPELIDHLQQTYIPNSFMVSRLIINMQTIRPEWSMNAIHPDLKGKNVEDAVTILYYVNNSDGDTFFFDEEKCIKRVSPIKGTAAIYPSRTFHAGSTPTKTQTRTVINIVFEPKQKR